jgi:hypothetical protein
MIGSRFWVQGSEVVIPDIAYFSTRCSILDTGYWIGAVTCLFYLYPFHDESQNVK